MELFAAIRLIEQGVDKIIQPQTWADLGAGSGLFTKALSSVIHSGTIFAVDKEGDDLSAMSKKPSVRVKSLIADFTSENLNIEFCDGILMANSLHYVADKASLLRNIKRNLKSTGVMIIIEYDRSSSNPWVPYPIRFQELEKLISTAGFSSMEKIGEEPSVFDNSLMYSSLIRQ